MCFDRATIKGVRAFWSRGTKVVLMAYEVSRSADGVMSESAAICEERFRLSFGNEFLKELDALLDGGMVGLEPVADSSEISANTLEVGVVAVGEETGLVKLVLVSFVPFIGEETATGAEDALATGPDALMGSILANSVLAPAADVKGGRTGGTLERIWVVGGEAVYGVVVVAHCGGVLG